MPDRPVTPEQTNQPVTDRPDDRDWKAEIADFIHRSEWTDAVRDVPDSPLDEWGTLAWARLALRLADALEAAQKERDALKQALADELAEWNPEDRPTLMARVRQLEEALSCAIDDAVDRWHETCPHEERGLAEWLGLTQEQYADFVADWRAIIPVLAARDALAAKENTTP